MQTLEHISSTDTKHIGLKEQLNQLTHSDLVTFRLASDRSILTFEFTTGPQGTDYTLQLSEVIHLVFSQTPGDEAPYFVGEVTVKMLPDGGEKALAALGYGFRDRSGGTPSFPSVPLYHVRLEGGIYFEVVCKQIQLSQVRPQPSQDKPLPEYEIDYSQAQPNHFAGRANANKTATPITEVA